MKKFPSTLFVYVIGATVILGWWWVAFHEHLGASPHGFSRNISIKEDPSNLVLGAINRATLKQALMGDVSLMMQLMAEWDTDAQLLQKADVEGIQRLKAEDYLEAQTAARKLLATEDVFTGRYLPQTYASATFLLALLSPEQLVAIPGGMRSQTDLYPLEHTCRIRLDTDRYNAELVCLAKPDAAFVASYSHPSTVEALTNQGILLHSIDGVHTLEEIQQSLLEVGNAVGKGQKAKLLKQFMEAAVMAIDNRLRQVKSEHGADLRVLFLNYYHQFSAPSPKLIAGHLAQRLGMNASITSLLQEGWQIELDTEHIVTLQPDALIIAAPIDADPQGYLSRQVGILSLPAVQKGHVYLVDSRVQESPTQLSVLAYLDLAETLMEIYRTQ